MTFCQFGQFVDVNSGRESTLFGQNPNLRSVTAFNEKNTNLGSVTA